MNTANMMTVSPGSASRFTARLKLGLVAGAGLLAVLALTPVTSTPAEAQGVFRGAEQGARQGAREGNRAAGPVGGAVGGAIGLGVGGVVGGVKGVLGIPEGSRRQCRGYYDSRNRFHCYKRR